MSVRLTFNAGTGYDKSGHHIAELPVQIMTIRQMLAATFGGFTETDVYGGWMNPDGLLVQEPGKQWAVVTDDDAMGYSMAQSIAQALNQDSVLLTREETQADFVPQSTTITAYEEQNA